MPPVSGEGSTRPNQISSAATRVDASSRPESKLTPAPAGWDNVMEISVTLIALQVAAT
jgi:hypothetical protein